MKPTYRLRNFLLQSSAASALLSASFVHAADVTLASSASAGGTITVNSLDSYTIAVGSTATRTLSNAITLGGGTLLGGVMDNVATVSGLSGAGTSSTFVDANGVTIVLKGSGTANTTANLTLASGVTVTGANQLLVGGGAGGGGGRASRRDGGGGGGGYVVLTTGNLSDTLALTAGGGSAGMGSGGGATAAGGTSSIGATTASGGGGAASSSGTPNGNGGNSSQTISGTTTAFTGGTGFSSTNGGGGGGAGSSANGVNGVADKVGGAGGAGTQITTGVVGLTTYLGSNTFGGGGGGGGDTTRGAGGAGGGGQGAQGGAGGAGTDGLGGGGGGGANGSSGLGGVGGAGSVAIQYAYDSNVAAGTLTLSGGITLNSTSTLDAVRSGGLIDVTTNGITGSGGLNIVSSASSGGVVRLSAANTYTGATNVNSGALIVNGNISSSLLTTVASGATLGGSGTLGKTVINGTLAIGNSPGTMTFINTLGLNGNDVMEIDGITGAGVVGGHDFINLTGIGSAGVLTYGGTMTLDMGVVFAVGSYSWNLFDMASETGTFTAITLTDQYSGNLLDTDLNGTWDLSSGNNTWQFTESSGELSLTVIPEPDVAALIGGLGILLLLRRRRA